MMTNGSNGAQKEAPLLPKDYREWTPEQIMQAPSNKMPKHLDVGEWSFKQITAALSRRLDPSLLGTKKKGGAELLFIPWYLACDILDKYAPGWSYDVEVTPMADRVIIKATIEIVARDCTVRRSSTGQETLKQMNSDGTPKLSQDGQLKEHAYGDPVSNAEGMALRRAGSKFGLGRKLYCK